MWGLSPATQRLVGVRPWDPCGPGHRGTAPAHGHRATFSEVWLFYTPSICGPKAAGPVAANSYIPLTKPWLRGLAWGTTCMGGRCSIQTGSREKAAARGSCILGWPAAENLLGPWADAGAKGTTFRTLTRRPEFGNILWSRSTYSGCGGVWSDAPGARQPPRSFRT